MADEATTEAAEQAADTTTPAAGESTADGQNSEPEVEGADALGDPGKKALDAMKAAKKAAEAEVRKLRDEIEALRAQVEGKEAEFAAEQERRKVEAEALAKANERILKAEVRAAAAGKLADPADALLYVDLADFEVGENGEVDRAAIDSAINSLVKSKPYLAAQGGVVFHSPGATQGSSKAQLTKADLAGMTPEQIDAARKEGRLDALLGKKP